MTASLRDADGYACLGGNKNLSSVLAEQRKNIVNSGYLYALRTLTTMLAKNLFAVRYTTAYVHLLLIILACAYSVAAQAQTLDEQYANYLKARCANLNFERDGQLDLLPGQAGPQLSAYCSGPVPVGDVIVNNASGGGAGSEVGRGGEDSTLRRRRLRNKNNGDAASIAADAQTKADADDFSIAGSSNLNGYIALRYQHEKQDTTHYEGGRRSNLYGVTVGSDYRFGNAGLLGLAVKLDDLKGDFDSGGDFKTRTQGVMVYGSWYPLQNAFIDLTGGMDFASLDTRRIVSLLRTIFFFPDPPGGSSTSVDIAPAAAHSSPDSRAIMAEIRTGYDVSLGSVTIGPRLAVMTRHNKLDAYVESGATPMTLAFDEQTEKSLRSSLGFQGSMVFTPRACVFVVQLNLDWLHEFQNDQRRITVRFAEDLRPTPTRFQFLTEAPDRDVLNARLSGVAVFHNGFSGFVSVENLFAHSYLSRFGASVGVRKEF